MLEKSRQLEREGATIGRMWTDWNLAFPKLQHAMMALEQKKWVLFSEHLELLIPLMV